jgi:hypothetical protein
MHIGFQFLGPFFFSGLIDAEPRPRWALQEKLTRSALDALECCTWVCEGHHVSPSPSSVLTAGAHFQRLPQVIVEFCQLPAALL